MPLIRSYLFYNTSNHGSMSSFCKLGKNRFFFQIKLHSYQGIKKPIRNLFGFPRWRSGVAGTPLTSTPFHSAQHKHFSKFSAALLVIKVFAKKKNCLNDNSFFNGSGDPSVDGHSTRTCVRQLTDMSPTSYRFNYFVIKF